MPHVPICALRMYDRFLGDAGGHVGQKNFAHFTEKKNRKTCLKPIRLRLQMIKAYLNLPIFNVLKRMEHWNSCLLPLFDRLTTTMRLWVIKLTYQNRLIYITQSDTVRFLL